MTPGTMFASNALAGKSAFISGGTSGINLGIAKVLAAAGARVAVLGRDPDKAARAAAEISTGEAKALAFTADVRNFSDVSATVQEAADQFGGIDYVIAGAAGNFIAPASDLSANGFAAVVQIDLNGTFHLFRAAYPHLKRPGASLLAISAGQAVRASWGQSHAAAAKAGIEALVRNLALEWGPEGIRVNGLCPGPVSGTEGVARLIPAEQVERLTRRLPLRRFAERDEIGQAALFLLSEAASYVTGTVLTCDGGLTLIGDDTQPLGD